MNLKNKFQIREEKMIRGKDDYFIKCDFCGKEITYHESHYFYEYYLCDECFKQYNKQIDPVNFVDITDIHD